MDHLHRERIKALQIWMNVGRDEGEELMGRTSLTLDSFMSRFIHCITCSVAMIDLRYCFA